MNTQISNFMKIRSLGTYLGHAEDRRADGQTYMTKLIVAFSNFVGAYKNAQNVLTTWGTVSFSTRFVLHRVKSVSSHFSYKNFFL